MRCHPLLTAATLVLAVTCPATLLPAVTLPTPQQALEDPIPEPIPTSSLNLGLDIIATGNLVAPNFLTEPNDGSGRRFIVDQVGVVQTFRDGSLQSEPFLDVRDRLINLNPASDERGLLGLAFHPEFAANGKLYTYTSEPVDGPADFSVPLEAGQSFNHQSVISEWTIDPANPDRVDPDSRREVMRIDQPNANHNAGTLMFGPDGNLYASLGDGGGADDQEGQILFGGQETIGKAPGGNGQEPGNILGTIIRIDPDGNNSANGQYGIPGDNPFVDDPDALDEIFAFGFRNPYRFSFDRLTGEMLVGDVGQRSIEEIDLVIAGGNYGWNVKEGTFLFDPRGTAQGEIGVVTENSPGSPDGLIDPVLQYDHDEGEAVIGGFVYRGEAIPELLGQYVFGDFTLDGSLAAGQIFIGNLDTGEIARLDFTGLGFGWYLKGFGEDADGELYALLSSEAGQMGQGAVGRLVPAQDGVDDGIIPEPATAATMGLALAAMAGGFGRRRRR